MATLGAARVAVQDFFKDLPAWLVSLIFHLVLIILLVVYALSLVFALKTHAHLNAGEDHGTQAELPDWSIKKALVVLVKTNAVTPFVAAASSRFSVPVMLVSTKSCRECVAMCGL